MIQPTQKPVTDTYASSAATTPQTKWQQVKAFAKRTWSTPLHTEDRKMTITNSPPDTLLHHPTDSPANEPETVPTTGPIGASLTDTNSISPLAGQDPELIHASTPIISGKQTPPSEISDHPVVARRFQPTTQVPSSLMRTSRSPKD